MFLYFRLGLVAYEARHVRLGNYWDFLRVRWIEEKVHAGKQNGHTFVPSSNQLQTCSLPEIIQDLLQSI